MDKLTRRYIKVNKDGKINKKHLKNKEKIINNKSKFEQLLLDFKQRKNIPNQGKVTSERNVVKTGIFQNAIRSDIVSRSDASKLTEESRHILREDLMKIIGLKSQKTVKESNLNESEVLNRFCNNLCLQDNSPTVEPQKFSDNFECVSDEKSLFRVINEKYENIVNDSLKSENECCMDLENTNVGKYFESKMEQLENSDIWEAQSADVLDHNKSQDYKFTTIKSILQEQKQIVENCTSSDLIANYRDTPVSNTMKRKFIKRFNEMTLVNNCQSELVHFNSVEVEGLNVQPQGFSTPIKNSIFPETSYHTPENQKYVYKVPDSEVYQTVLYVAPDNQQKHFKDRVCQKENFIELVVPSSVSEQPGLYEITTQEQSAASEFVFNPKIEKVKSRDPFGSLENIEKNVLSRWKNQIKHVYECGPKKENIQLDEKTVINLKKNLLFDDCDNVLSRPKKICKRNRSSDVTLRNISSSPFNKFMTESNDSCNNNSKSEIRRKLNYSTDLSYDGDNFVNLESEDIENFPTSIFSDFEEPKTSFNFTKPKSYFETSESKKHKIDYNCKYCSKHKDNSSSKHYKDTFVPQSPVYDDRGQAILVPKSPKYKPSKRFSLEIGESSKSGYFFEKKHFSPIKSHHSHNRHLENQINSPSKLESFKNFQGISIPNSSSENFEWKPFEDFTQIDSLNSDVFKSKSLSQRSRSPYTINTNRSYSPIEKKNLCAHCLRSPKRNKLQVVPLSPSEYMLRKKVLPHTVTSDMKPKNPDSPVFRLF